MADSFYGEDRGFRQGLRDLQVGYVLALKPSHEWYHPEAEIGSFQEAAQEAGWERPERPGRWIKVTRTFRDGSSQDWWGLELDIRPFGPDKPERVVVPPLTQSPYLISARSSLFTNLPAPGSPWVPDSAFAAASVEEVVRLYGLRMWVEESYRQVKHAASLVGVSGQERPGHETALAARVLCFFLLLVSPGSCSHHRSTGGSHSAPSPGS